MSFDRQAWLEWRRGGIGASDVAGILSLSPWQSPYSIWATKMQITDDEDATEAMLMGQALEPAIASMFQSRTGLYVAGEQTMVTHPDEPWARCTLDGFVVESPGSSTEAALGGLESKSTSDSPKAWEEEVPVQYAAQVQFQMFCTGLSRTWLAVFHANWGLKFRIYEVERDDDDIAVIVDRCRAFWTDFVETGEPPPTDAHWATTDALRSIRAMPGERVDLDDNVAVAVEQLRILKAESKLVDEAIAGYENEIKAALADCTEGFVDGRPVVSWREQQRNAIDQKAFREHEPEIAEKFTTSSPVRVLRLAKVKEA